MEDNVTSLLMERPDFRRVLEFLVEFEERNKESAYFQGLGWEWKDVYVDPATLRMLDREGILKKVYDSNAHKGYLLTDRTAVKRALEHFSEWETVAEEESAEIPSDMFSIIYGHEDVKELFRKSLQAEKPVNILLVGDVSSAKSLFLSELYRLKSSEFLLGGTSTKVGIRDIIMEKPRYIILDELDKITSPEDTSSLLSWMESGVMAVTKHGLRKVVQGKSWVFAAANRVDRLSKELLSRFLKVNIPRYTEEELRGVIIKVLTEREGRSRDIAEYIAEKVIKNLGSRDPRDAVRVSRIAKEKEDVDWFVETMKKYGKRI